MEQNEPTYRDYARYASQSPEEVARDCKVSVFRGTGPGGQGVNTTDSSVRMTHLPTGIVVTSRDSRSQLRNREACLRKLHLIFTSRMHPPKVRKKTKVSRAAKERRLREKRHIAEKKASRKPPSSL